MKIALIKVPSTYADWYRRPVLGISYISAYLELAGFDCKIFDAYFHSWSEKELLEHVINYKPEVVAFTAMTHEIVWASDIAVQLKKQLNVPAVIGGCHLTALPKRTLEEFPVFDYGIYGEGEKTTLELLKYLKQGSSESRDVQLNAPTIKGIVFRGTKERIFVNEPRPFLTSEELNALPYPAFHHYYGNNPRALTDKDSYYVMFTSRGCPYNCAFCMRVLGRKIRRRTAENIYLEMEYAISHYGAHTFDFADEIFLFPCKETQELLHLIIKGGLSKRIKWSGLTRANFVNLEFITLAKESGCYHLEMGVESGDDEILKAIGKAITVEQVKRAVKVIKDAGISLKTYFILGHPNENRQTLRKTINLATELNTTTIAVGIMVPYPGTKIFNMALRNEGGYRLLTQGWPKYDKYGGKALELEGLPYEELVKWQIRALSNFYLKNFRLIDYFKFLWQIRNAIYFFINKLIRGRINRRICG